MSIDLTPVRTLYNKVINVEEYFHPVKKWTSILPNGHKVTNPELYYTDIPNNLELVVQACIDAGAIMIQFRCKDKRGEECYPDYKISELVI